MTDPNHGTARPGPAAAGIALAVLSVGTFGTSGIFASALISTGWSPAAVAIARLGGSAVLLGVPAVLQLRGRWALLRRQAGTVVVYGMVAIAGGPGWAPARQSSPSPGGPGRCVSLPAPPMSRSCTATSAGSCRCWNQLLAYCTVLGLHNGYLVYAKGNENPAHHVVRRSGIEIFCHAIDLDQEPDALISQMRDLAQTIASAGPTVLVSSAPFKGT